MIGREQGRTTTRPRRRNAQTGAGLHKRELAVTPILFFGAVSDRFGATLAFELPAEGLTVAELRRRLADAEPAGAEALLRPGVRASVDQVLVDEAARVRPGQEVAFLSPFSGG
jgi:molybdopterin synthase sulfur carrier subunit